jgi:hypothetical protein
MQLRIQHELSLIEGFWQLTRGADQAWRPRYLVKMPVAPRKMQADFEATSTAMVYRVEPARNQTREAYSTDPFEA